MVNTLSCSLKIVGVVKRLSQPTQVPGSMCRKHMSDISILPPLNWHVVVVNVEVFVIFLLSILTRKPCCRRESARCRCNFRSIDQDMINKDQWRTDVKLSYVTYLINL